MSTNFRLQLIEPSARKTLVEIKEQRGEGASEERSEHGEAIYLVFNLLIMKIKY